MSALSLSPGAAGAVMPPTCVRLVLIVTVVDPDWTVPVLVTLDLLKVQPASPKSCRHPAV